MDYKRVLHGVARLLHVPDAFKLLLVILAEHVLILQEEKKYQEVDFYRTETVAIWLFILIYQFFF